MLAARAWGLQRRERLEEKLFARSSVSADETLSTDDNGGMTAAVFVPMETIVVMLRPS
jgi:hypothetical protein